MKELKRFTKRDTVSTMYSARPNETDNIGKVAILPYSFFEPQYRTPDNQLFRLTGGFGTSPLGRGNACYGYFCNDGEKCRVEKYQFVGIGNADVEKIAEELEARWKQPEKDGQKENGIEM